MADSKLVNSITHADRARTFIDRNDRARRLNIDDNGNIGVTTEASADADPQNPVPTNMDSIYASDIDTEISDIGDFSGEITDPFNSLNTIITNATGDNPKILKIEFKRSAYISSVALGCNSAGNFGNSITLKLLGSNDVIRSTIASTGDGNSRNIKFAPEIANGIILEFNTVDQVCLSNISIQKEISTRSTIQGQKPDGTITTFQSTQQGNFRVSINEYGDTPAIDPFDRLRVSNPFTLFDSKQIHDKQPLFWDERLGGSATSVHSIADARTRMTVTASASDYAMRQTKQRLNYQPGKGQLILMTFLSCQTEGVTKRIGCFNIVNSSPYMTPKDGIFLEMSDAVYWKIAKNGSITESVPQENWNVDTLDGSGDINNPSGLTLNLDATQISIIDYEWLGVGRVRVGFVINGIIIYTHYFNHANNGFTSVYMSTPNLPLRYDIQSDGSATCSIDHICATVMSEGGVEETGILRSVDTGSTHIDADVANTTYAVKGIRLKEAYRDVTVVPEFFSMINEAGDDFRWCLLLNPTISGTFTYTDVTNSAVQQASGSTANTVTNEGLRIDSGYTVAGSFGAGGQANRKFVTSLRMGSTIDRTVDQIVLCVTPLTAGADIQASLTFRELL